MENPKNDDDRDQAQPQPPASDHDSRGTKIERVPGPGPKDAGKGAAGKEAKDRLDRNH
jgi:hypothetical protein